MKTSRAPGFPLQTRRGEPNVGRRVQSLKSFSYLGAGRVVALAFWPGRGVASQHQLGQRLRLPGRRRAVAHLGPHDGPVDEQ
jgi:hypothetical protein